MKFVGWSSVHGLLTENLILEAVLIMEEMIAQLMEDTAVLIYLHPNDLFFVRKFNWRPKNQSSYLLLLSL